jgi:hypothetical protein
VRVPYHPDRPTMKKMWMGRDFFHRILYTDR